MKVLITGVAGLLGSRLADWIHENHPDVEIVGVDDLSGGYRENIGPYVEFWRMKTESERLQLLFASRRPDIVYHLAAYAAEGLSPFIRMYNYTNNVVATMNVINNCITYNVRRLVFTSSMAVYGHGTPPFSEKRPCNPVDPYGIAKTACEADIQVAGVQHGLDWCIIRPHNVYGVKQNIWDVYRNVLGIWMYNVLHNKPITIYGDGLQTRAFTYVDDILPCLWKAGTENNCSKEIINLGGIEKTTILEAAETLTEVVKRSSKCPEIVFLPPRFEVKHAYCTWQKSVDLLGFKHLTSLEEGLSRMWDWAQQQPDRKRFVWPSYEISKGIYPYWKQAELKD